MAKQADPKTLGAVQALQSTLVNNLSPFVFYNDPTLGKCLARVSGFPGERSPAVRDANENIGSGGQILFWLSVDHNDGGQDFKVKAAYSGDGTPGTFRLANDGDLADHVNMSKLKLAEQTPGIAEEVVEDSPQEGAPASPGTQLEGDTDGDGELSKQERKNLRKGK